MHPSIYATATPDKPAIIMATSRETVTFGELEEQSNRIAHFYRTIGLNDGDCVAILVENHPRFFKLVWAAQRSGLYYACISTKLNASEVAYLLADSDAKAFITSDAMIDTATEAAAGIELSHLYTLGGARGKFQELTGAIEQFPVTPISDEANGMEMLYSSGTTGIPKGVKPDRPEGPLVQPTGLTSIGEQQYTMNADSIYLSPAPLYHAAPLRWSMTIQRFGGTVIVMERFDAEQTLALIEEFKVTHAQFVPTHFVRMLKLLDNTKGKYDLSSLITVFHAAAPCPIPVKQQMIDWFGPIIHEYYAGTEMNGFTAISTEEWLNHIGSVGQSMWGEIKICDEEDNSVSPGEEGLVYFADGPKFRYHKDPEKTQAATNRHGWTTLGDIGKLDDEGFLYLTDRKSFTIISGGVNIYPQEIENLFITHPKVADAAVIGAPDDDLGERVVAVIEPANWADATDIFRDELIKFARVNLSHVKTPKQVDFIQHMPRLPTGKLPKRLIKDPYWKLD